MARYRLRPGPRRPDRRPDYFEDWPAPLESTTGRTRKRRRDAASSSVLSLRRLNSSSASKRISKRRKIVAGNNNNNGFVDDDNGAVLSCDSDSEVGVDERLFPTPHDRHSGGVTSTASVQTRCSESASLASTPGCETGVIASPSVAVRKRRSVPSDGAVPRRSSKRLIDKHLKFPFDQLPPECQSHIFSLLSAKDRLSAARVCRSWRSLASAPGVWTRIDFTQFRVAASSSGGADCERQCRHHEAYEAYRADVGRYVELLSRRFRPLPKELRFAFDLGHATDGWFSVLLSTLDPLTFKNLVAVHAKWDNTPNRPVCLTRYCCLVGQMRAVFHRHVQRSSKFGTFLHLLSKQAPNLLHLRLPFDWRLTHVCQLTRFSRLQSLTLDHYQTFAQLQPWKVQLLLHHLKKLESLVLVYVSPSFKHTTLYDFTSASLRRLDVSGCVGFFLRRLATPRLTTLTTGRLPWQGSLRETDRLTIPCLADVVKGAPALETFNGFNCDFASRKSDSEDDAASDAATSIVRRCRAAPKRRSISAPSKRRSSSTAASRRRESAWEKLLQRSCPCRRHGVRGWRKISTEATVV